MLGLLLIVSSCKKDSEKIVSNSNDKLTQDQRDSFAHEITYFSANKEKYMNQYGQIDTTMLTTDINKKQYASLYHDYRNKFFRVDYEKKVIENLNKQTERYVAYHFDENGKRNFSSTPENIPQINLTEAFAPMLTSMLNDGVDSIIQGKIAKLIGKFSEAVNEQLNNITNTSSSTIGDFNVNRSNLSESIRQKIYEFQDQDITSDLSLTSIQRNKLMTITSLMYDNISSIASFFDTQSIPNNGTNSKIQTLGFLSFVKNVVAFVAGAAAAVTTVATGVAVGFVTGGIPGAWAGFYVSMPFAYYAFNQVSSGVRSWRIWR